MEIIYIHLMIFFLRVYLQKNEKPILDGLVIRVTFYFLEPIIIQDGSIW